MWLKSFLKGMVIGIANILPGISGATLAIALGIYDKLIHAVTHIRSEFKQSIKLLVPVFLGAIIAIVAVARLVEFLFINLPFQTNLLFIGLILGGLPPMFKRVKGQKMKPQYIVAIVVLAALIIWGASLHANGEGTTAELSGSFTNIALFFGMGLLSSATMVIPGVSGSMLLMILGYYTPLLSMINMVISDALRFDVPALINHGLTILPFGLGVLVGVVAIAQFLEFAFKRFPTLSTWGIIGLIAASPIAILMMNQFVALNFLTVITGLVTLALGLFLALRLGKDE